MPRRKSIPRSPATPARGLLRRRAVALLLLLLSLAALALSGLGRSWAAAERASEYELKSAFVYNLLAFVDWPAGAIQGPLVVGFAGEGPMEAALPAFLKDKKLGSLALEVRSAHRRDELRACNVLYLAYPDATRMREALSQVQGASILTIGEGEEFARMGGLIGLVARGNTLRLAVNPAAVQRAHLEISAKVLNMSTLVEDEGGGGN